MSEAAALDKARGLKFGGLKDVLVGELLGKQWRQRGCSVGYFLDVLLARLRRDVHCFVDRSNIV